MKEYTYSEARQQLATVLDEVIEYGQVRIVRRDGTSFTIRLDERDHSPLNVEPVQFGKITAEEIVSAVRESREQT